jgi:hypothetical protein
MSDYIMNRESLKRHCEAMCHKFKDVPTSGTYGEHRLVLDLLEQTEWIPCNKRLPNNDEYIKNNGLFNVSDGNRSYSEWFDIYDTQRFGEPTISGFRVDYAVTAWMPLPKSYEPQEKRDRNESVEV